MQRKQSHRGFGRDARNAPRGLDSVYDGHLPVKNHDVGLKLLELFDGCPTILRLCTYFNFRVRPKKQRRERRNSAESSAIRILYMVQPDLPRRVVGQLMVGNGQRATNCLTANYYRFVRVL
jgi:hypothetical protein